MKSVSNKKKSHTGLWLLMMCVAMAAFTVFLCAKQSIINIRGITPQPIVLPTVTYGYLDAASSAGTEADRAVRFRTVTVTEDTLIPDDVVYPDDDLTGYVTKIDLYANTPLTWSMLCPVGTDEYVNDSTRRIEINYIQPNASLHVGDYVDIRLKISNGANTYDYRDEVIVSKKEIIAIDGSTLILELNEDELMLLTSAGVEATITNREGAKGNSNRQTGVLYTTIYVSTAQKKATITYSNDKLKAMLAENPNFINNPEGFVDSFFGEETTDTETEMTE